MPSAPNTTVNESYTHEQIALLVNNFTNKTLSKAEWTHHAHIIVAIWYIHNFDFLEAICRLKSDIILLNNTHKTENTSTTGYHETITIFWSNVIKLFINIHKEWTTEQLVNCFLCSGLADREFPFEFYEKQNLLSADLRAMYHEPDKRRVDDVAIRDKLAKNNT